MQRHRGFSKFWSVFVQGAVFAGVLCLAPNVFANDGVIILDKDLPQPISAGRQLSYYIDDQGSLTLDDVRSQNETLEWQTHDMNVPNFGFSSSIYWFRGEAEIRPGAPKTWYLVQDWPIIYTVDVFLIGADGEIIHEAHVGTNVPFSERPTASRRFVMPIELTESGRVKLFVRVASANSMQVPLFFWEPGAYNAHDRLRQSLEGIFLGILIIMALYNLLVYLVTHDMTYAWLAGFITAFGILQADFFGTAIEYLWPNHPNIQERSIGVLVSLVIVFGGTFSYRFLELRKKHPRLSRIILGHVYAAVVSTILALFIPPLYATILAAAIVVPVVSFLLAAGILVWKGGSSAGKFYTIAWSFFLAGASVLAIQKFGLLPYNILTENFIVVGSAMQVILLSLALAEKINEDARQIVQAQEAAIEKEREMRRFQEFALEEERDSKAKLASALRNAEEAAKQKGQFLANMSHELRTPLNAVINVPNLILEDIEATRYWRCDHCDADYADPDLNPGQAPEHEEQCPECGQAILTFLSVNSDGNNNTNFQLLARARRSGNYLLHVINSLLDFSKIEAGKMKLALEPIPVGEILEEIEMDVRDQAKHKGLELTIGAMDIGTTIHADRLRLRQILFNLADNALRFTTAGSIKIETFPCAEEPSMMRFSVRDTGCGIPEVAQGDIFESFRQADQSHTRKHDGAGLGLSICRNLVELHGGRIDLESVPDEGSNFTFTIPLADSALGV